MKIDTTQRIFGLDVMRAIAILLVLFSHTSLLMFPETESIILTVIRFFGAIGVDIFFVLSGFLVGRILIDIIYKTEFSSKNLVNFWIRRWFRTIPAYFLVLTVLVLARQITQGNLGAFSYKFYLFIQNLYSVHPRFYPEAWSLSVEEWF